MTPIIFVNNALVGAYAFVAVHHFYLWRVSRGAGALLLVALFSLFSALQVVAIVVLGTTSDLDSAQAALESRATFGIAVTILQLWLTAELTHYRPRKFLLPITVLLAACLLINLVVSVTGTVKGFVAAEMLWGETIQVIERRPGIFAIALPLYLAVLSAYSFGALAGIRCMRTDRTAGILIAITGALGFLLSLFALLIDLGMVLSPYPGPLGNGLWILVSTILVAREHDKRGDQLAKSEARLAISEARYRTLIESAPEAIVVLDAEARRFVDFNAEACRFFGASAERLLPLSPVELSPPTQPDGRSSAIAARDYIGQAIDGHAPVFEWMHRTLAGKDIPCEVRLVRLPDPSRVLVRGSVTDISERLRLEEQLRQSHKMEAIGQLAGGVAHDFNNLLTVIAGYAEILLAKLPSGDANATLVKAIGDATERAAWLTARLLAFGRRAVLTPQVFDLNALVGDGERILRRLIGEHIALRVESAAAPLNVKLDPGQWSQVMLNLAINARDAMPAGGVLSIRTFGHLAEPDFLATHPGLAAGRYAAFSVTDTGLGMASDIKARIFEPFFTTKELGKGTGLGLAVVHGIVTQAGGRIDVDTAPGAGTTFTVYLPAVEAAPRRERIAASGHDHGAGESILVVEDEAVLRELLEVALTAHGFRVSTAGDGEEALAMVESLGASLELLVTDMVMPGRFNGRDLAAAVRERFPRVKVLFISGYIDDPAVRMSGFGPDETCLQKPFSLAAIAQKARETLDAK